MDAHDSRPEVTRSACETGGTPPISALTNAFSIWSLLPHTRDEIGLEFIDMQHRQTRGQFVCLLGSVGSIGTPGHSQPTQMENLGV
jgi:hypothetical protein